MPIYLIFNNILSTYVCINQNRQNIPLEDLVRSGSSVDFLSNQLKLFENLKIKYSLQNCKSIIFKNAQNEFFCSNNGNVPFLFTPLTARGLKKHSIEGFAKFKLSMSEIPVYRSIQVTKQIAQSLETSWAINCVELIKRQGDYNPENMESNMSGTYLKQLSTTTRYALIRRMNKEMETKNVGISAEMLEKQADDIARITNLTMPSCQVASELPKQMECTEDNARELVFGMYKNFYEYEANQECMDAFEELGTHLIQQACQSEEKSTSPRCVTQSQTSNKFGEISLGRK